MHPLAKGAAAASQVLARMHRWRATVRSLSRMPLAQLDGNSVGRLQYALMLASRTDPAFASRELEVILRRNEDTTSELRIELAAMATSIGSPVAAELLVRAQREAADPDTADAAQRLLNVHYAMEEDSLEREVQAKVDLLAISPSGATITLVPISSRYLDLWRLWLLQTRKHIGGTVFVLAMDDAALHAVRGEPDVTTVDVRHFFSWGAYGALHPRTRGVLWYLRVLFLRDLVRRGHTVLVLDLDAIAVDDLAPMLADTPDADVIAQQDYSIPVDVARELGFILCCGFMVWRPSAATRRLLDRFASETALERDDQLALNHLLARDGIEDRHADAQALRFRSNGVQFVCPDASLVSRSLSSGSVIRHFHQEGKSIADLRQAMGITEG